ncbi:ADP-ribosylglycohydrolase family protein [Agromyces sp. NPDC058110]|uniref:ADP-ribosylglycohydrolase family protein n=1 Tax=Agromyces sp. NPDC058110 TaxID=3346345 RepID=UPI0036D78F63
MKAWKRRVAIVAASALVTAALPLTLGSSPALAATVTISKATYLDKTLAGILGQVGGVVTGYEFASPNPYPTDVCFDPAKGPYSGDAPLSCWTPNSYPGYDRVGAPNFASNEVGGDDDYHVDFFNQHILDEHGPDATFQDIKDEWVAHDIGDWGPGEVANAAMRTDGLIPPLTGYAENNRFSWLTEAYIENDTIGMVAPGMPETARDLTAKFASVTTQGDSVVWAELYGAMYSLAYTATDIRDVLAEASKTLPRNGWPYQVYEKVVALHEQNPTDWRWAQGQLMAFVRDVYAQDNAQALPDRNNGSFIISILYGGNDYLTTLKIASLIGNDADCTASGVAGILGIIKGMGGTPQAFKDVIYQNGNGRYINDLTTGFPPNIKNDYPRSQSWDSLAQLYLANASDQVVARGGSQDATNLYVNQQTLQPPAVVLIDNADFERGTIDGWTKWTSATDTGSPNAFAEQNGTAQSGKWKGTVFTDAAIDQVRLSTTVRGLTAGATYRVRAYVQSDQAARLYVSGFGGTELYQSVVGSYVNANHQWVVRSVEFTPTGSSAEVGLHMPSGPDGFAAIDDLVVERITAPTTVVAQAESGSTVGGTTSTSASASGGSYVGGLDDTGDYVQVSVTVPTAGEYRASVAYANAYSAPGRLALATNGAAKATIPFPRTESWGTFSRNVVNVPVVLNAGANTIRLTKPAGGGFVELDAITVSSEPQVVTSPITEIAVVNAGFESGGATQNPASWSTWAGTAGTSGDADFSEAGGFAGGYRLTHAKGSAHQVFTEQTLSGLANGTYTVTAWSVGGGDQSSAFLSVKGYGTSVPELTSRASTLGWPEWRRLSVSGVQVTNGQLTLGMYTDSAGGTWSSYDAVRVWRQ